MDEKWPWPAARSQFLRISWVLDPSRPSTQISATQLNLRRGMRTEGESEAFKLRCEHIVQPVELHVVDSDFELKKQLVHNKVVVFEMEEITMTPEEESVEFGVNEMTEAEMSVAIGKYK